MSDTTQDLEQWDPNEDDTIIVPLEDDYALVVGPNTKGLEKIDGSLVGDRALNDLIASIGEGASLSGGAASAANAIQHMSGLYKLDAVTKAQLAAGNVLTKTADGRLIGAVRNTGGQITRQARLIPVSAPQIKQKTPDRGSHRSHRPRGRDGGCADATQQHFQTGVRGSANRLTDSAHA